MNWTEKNQQFEYEKKLTEGAVWLVIIAVAIGVWLFG